ncbi:thymidylate synthase [Actinokineospora sp. 24-640]
MPHAGFHEAYLAQLAELLARPRFSNAPRGFSSVERLGVSFEVADARRRLVPCPVRRANIVFCLAEVLWYFAGRDDIGYLSYYAPGVSRFVSGADTVTGTAYGPRIFRFGATVLDQWASVARTLADDRDSKRAVVQIFQPEELTVPGNPDVACTLGLQFFIREDRLFTVGYMRANDAFRGMVSDVFSFTFLQELMAAQLGVGTGSYVHMVGSSHLYAPDAAAARRVVAASAELDDRMPAMPSGDQREHVDRLMAVEAALRVDRLRLTPDAVRDLPLPEYWRHVAVLFELYRGVRHGSARDTAALLAGLPPVYRRMISARFPSLNHSPIAAEAAS